MAIKNRPILLFFTLLVTASDDEIKQAEALEKSNNVNVKLRNGSVPENGSPEPCDFVAGNVPEAYLLRFPYIDGEGNVIQPDANAVIPPSHGVEGEASIGDGTAAAEGSLAA